MTLPITGPYSKSVRLPQPAPWGSYAQYAKSSTWYRQARPYDLRLNYEMLSGTADDNFGGSSPNPPIWDAGSVFLTYLRSSAFEDAKDRAWAKFVAETGDRAGLGTTLAEFSQATGMISARALQLFHFARAVKRHDWSGAAGYLRPTAQSANYGGLMKKRWKKSHDLSDVWLEVHFGWSPLMDDIYNSVKVLGSNIRPKACSGRGSAPFVETYRASEGGVTFANRDLRGLCRVKYTADISVENENVFTLNQLGLVNPAALLWEIVPWSFVVDWFANVSTWLNSYTDLLGLTVLNSSTTILQTLSGTETFYTSVSTFTGTRMTRTRTLERPDLHIRAPKLPSVSRAATAISLLVQQLPSRH